MPDANGKPLRADLDTPNPLLSNTAYDIIKDTVTIAFPAGAVGIFLGVLLKIASKKYEKLPTVYDGELIANDPDPDHETFRLDFDNSLPAMARQETVRLRVVDLLPKE